jgi:hypothetical protein
VIDDRVAAFGAVGLVTRVALHQAQTALGVGCVQRRDVLHVGHPEWHRIAQADVEDRLAALLDLAADLVVAALERYVRDPQPVAPALGECARRVGVVDVATGQQPARTQAAAALDSGHRERERTPRALGDRPGLPVDERRDGRVKRRRQHLALALRVELAEHLEHRHVLERQGLGVEALHLDGPRAEQHLRVRSTHEHQRATSACW